MRTKLLLGLAASAFITSCGIQTPRPHHHGDHAHHPEMVSELPHNSKKTVVHGKVYYVHDGVWYQEEKHGKYAIVPKPH